MAKELVVVLSPKDLGDLIEGNEIVFGTVGVVVQYDRSIASEATVRPDPTRQEHASPPVGPTLPLVPFNGH